MNKPKRSILRYHGGKWLLSKWIISHFPAHRIYTEVYGGAASVLLNKSRSYAEIYNDQWDLVVNVFEVIRDPDLSKKLEELLRLTPYSRTEFNTAAKKIFQSKDPVEKARLTISTSFQGFGSRSTNPDVNTGFRADSKRNGTTAMIDWMNYPDQIKLFTERLKGVTIENKDAQQVLEQHDTDETLHYVDPPYVHTTRNSSQKEYAFEMTDEDHVGLSKTLHSLSGMVVLSGYDSELYQDLYSTWTKVEKLGRTTNSKKFKKEVLWINAAASVVGQTKINYGE